MATQARCAKCSRVSAASDLRYNTVGHFKPSRLLLWLVGGGFLAWVLMQLLVR